MKHIVTINGKEHVLTDDEARRLYAELDALFGKSIPFPGYIAPAPIVIDQRPWDTGWPLPPNITCATQ